MKNKSFLFIVLLLPFLAKAQRIYSKVEKEVPYISYAITGNESLMDISHKFKIDQHELTSFNHLSNEAVLTNGQQLKVPLTHVLIDACETDCFDVYYAVQPSEGLYRVGKNFGYPNTTTLKKLNRLRSDALSKGQVLLVGYVSKELFQKTSEPLETVVESPKKIESQQTVVHPAFETIGEKKEAEDSAGLINMRYDGEGVFKSEYKNGHQQKELTASTFKTETGWRDGMFYVLVDKIEAGKVIRIQNKLTGKVIYAKVLSELPHISKKDAVQIRLSTAAANALGFADEQLVSVEVSY